nr:hypothetical protein [Tanacetum cinerariifolium]
MTGNKSFLTNYQEFDGGFVPFGGSLKDVKFMEKKNSVLFTETECLVLSHDFKLLDENQVFLKVPRQNNMYNFDLKNVASSGGRGQEWLFDIDSLTISMNYKLVTAGNQTNHDEEQARQEKASDHEYIRLPFMPFNSPLSLSTQSSDDKDADKVPCKGDEGVNKGSGVDDRERTYSSTQDAFPLPGIEFSLAEEVSTASEEGFHYQKKREATARKITLLSKSKRNCIEFSLAEEVSTASEEGFHYQKKREATARKITLLSKSKRNSQSSHAVLYLLNRSWCSSRRDSSRVVLTFTSFFFFFMSLAVNGLHKNLQIQLPPTGHNAHVEDIAVSGNAIARIFLYPGLVFWQQGDIVDLFLDV